MKGGGGGESCGYDRLAWFYERYWAREYHGPAFSIFDRLALREIPGGACVLDLCCGTGHLTRMLVERGFRVAGIDSSKGMLAEARRKMPDAEFIETDAREFRLPPVFHAALCGFEGISHILEERGLDAVVAELRLAVDFLVDGQGATPDGDGRDQRVEAVDERWRASGLHV